ncbi:leucine zipper protein 1 [Pseudophryne corroboree]|uniref:leucine zipper protein 1 n=1 Tax=Pseudophryne corroboree TaxID=495146 RepID=UPI0030818956
MEHSSRHLRFKLQSLGRRLDDLEEATKNLQKAEDEVLDLQDKIIQAEGSNSSMLADVEALRKRVLKIEGKDEEVKKAEDLCRLIKEKLENEENVTRELKLEIEQLQKRMSELEKLEETFNKSKNDCTQLCLSLNEEKNMSRKLASELEILRTRVRELESSENKLDRAEQFLTSELDKIKSLTLSFANERKLYVEREKQSEQIILGLKEQLEFGVKIITGDQTRNESNIIERSSDEHLERNNLRIEDNLTSKTSQRVGFDYNKQSEIQTSSKNENDKNKYQEDNKIKELNQEIEKLKNQLKHFEGLEEKLKQLKEKNCELEESFVSEQNKNKQVTEELQTLKRQVSQYKEIENGVFDSDDLPSRSRSKNERTKGKTASTEPPNLKYTSPDVSPQQLRSERSRNSESPFKRQTSNSGSNSRKSPRSTVTDTTTGYLKKQDDKLSSYFPSNKEFGSIQNEVKKSKDQPSVLSRYPPAVQDQAPQKSWKGSTSKHTDRSMKLFGDDYSVKVYSKKEISLENEEMKERPSDDPSVNVADTSLPKEIVPAENSSLSSTLYSEPINLNQNLNVQEDSDIKIENDLKSNVNSQDFETKKTSLDRLSRYEYGAGRDGITNMIAEEITKSLILSKDEIDPHSILISSAQISYIRDKTRSRASKPIIPEKPHILEASDHKETERRTRLSGLHTKRQSSTKERMAAPENMRASSFESHNHSIQREITETTRKMSSDGSENAETNSHISVRARSYSPREALQSTVIIKPIIIEKDMKEIMSDYRARSSSEVSRSHINTMPNKTTSSITIYPTDTVSSRRNTDETTRERHTSTSNIRLSANDQPVLKNNISIPFEISINRDNMLLEVSDKDITLDHREISKALDQSLLKEKTKGNDNDGDVEAVTWKTHNLDGTNHYDIKRTAFKSSWRSGVGGSTEELDRLITERADSDSKNRRKSCFDEEKSVRLRSRELYSRNKSSSVSSWSTTPEFISKRSQSSLSATEIISRRNTSNDSLTKGHASWNRPSIEVDDFSSRRKYTSEKMSRTDSSGWRQTQNQAQRHQKSMVEERIRQLEH